jgi:hypothetical protein
MAGTITGETKREGQRRPKDEQPLRIKKRERASPPSGKKLSHP